MKKILAAAFFSMVFPLAAYGEMPVGPFMANEQAASLNAFTLSYSDAEAAIGKALEEKGAGQQIAATMAGQKIGALYSYNQPIDVEIKGLQYDAPTKRWSANLLFMSGSEVVTAMPVSGRFEEMQEVPVLKRQVRNGELISGKDIELRLFPVSQTRTDTVSDMASLIGKTPVRTISSGRPIREVEIGVPSIVKKNALVQIRFVSGGMELSTSGQAVDEGAKGDVINVRNIASRKIVRGVIENASTVSVSPEENQASELNGAKAYETN